MKWKLIIFILGILLVGTIIGGIYMNRQGITIQDLFATFLPARFEKVITPIFFENWETSGFTNWTNSNFIIATDRVDTGTNSSKCAGALTCSMNPLVSLNTTEASWINVTFRINDNNLDANDARLSFNDSSGNWDFIGDLNQVTENIWVPISIKTTDSQYFHSGFSIRINSTQVSTENLWVDNINISYNTILTKNATFENGLINNTGSTGIAWTFNRASGDTTEKTGTIQTGVVHSGTYAVKLNSSDQHGGLLNRTLTEGVFTNHTISIWYNSTKTGQAGYTELWSGTNRNGTYIVYTLNQSADCPQKRICTYDGTTWAQSSHNYTANTWARQIIVVNSTGIFFFYDNESTQIRFISGVKSIGTYSVQDKLGYADDIGICIGSNFTCGDTTDNPPTWSSNLTNSTIAGTYVLHSVKWDDTALSGYIFEFDNGSGTFTNNSFVTMTGTTNWSNVTKYVNETIGSTIRWRVYANDSLNQWNSTSLFNYITTSADCWSDLGNKLVYYPTGCQRYITGSDFT